MSVTQCTVVDVSYTVYSGRCQLHSVQWSMPVTQCTVVDVSYTVYSGHVSYTVYSGHVSYTVYSGRCQLHSVQWSVSVTQCTVVDVSYTVYSGRCQLHSVQWSMSVAYVLGFYFLLCGMCFWMFIYSILWYIVYTVYFGIYFVYSMLFYTLVHRELLGLYLLCKSALFLRDSLIHPSIEKAVATMQCVIDLGRVIRERKVMPIKVRKPAA